MATCKLLLRGRGCCRRGLLPRLVHICGRTRSGDRQVAAPGGDCGSLGGRAAPLTRRRRLSRAFVRWRVTVLYVPQFAAKKKKDTAVISGTDVVMGIII